METAVFVNFLCKFNVTIGHGVWRVHSGRLSLSRHRLCPVLFPEQFPSSFRAFSEQFPSMRCGGIEN